MFERACEQGLEVVYRNREWGFRHRDKLMLAALRPGDDDETVRRIWNVGEIRRALEL